MTKDEALRLALEVLADLGMKHYENTGEVLYKNTYTAIKAALEKQDKPMHPQLKAMLEDYFDKCFAESASKRTWVGLTDQVKQEWIDAMPNPPQPRHFMVLVNAIESELKEKNT